MTGGLGRSSSGPPVGLAAKSFTLVWFIRKFGVGTFGISSCTTPESFEIKI